MYKGTYNLEDLSLDNILGIEAKTVKRYEILDSLWAIYQDGKKYLSAHEKDFIFMNRYEKEQFKNSELDDSYFSSLYLIYANDLHGSGQFYKWLSTPATREQMTILERILISSETLDANKLQLIEAKILVEIDRQKAIIDLLYLKESAEQWEEYLYDNRSTTNYKLLKEFIAETLTHFKELKKDVKNKALGNNTFLHRKLQLFLFSKYAFITAKKITETFDRDKHYFALKLGIENLRFDEYSIAHILMRHYAQGIRNYDFIRSKSIHIGDFPFNKIHFKLDEIFFKN